MLRLSIKGVRSLERAEVEIGAGVTMVCGRNGAGKTTLSTCLGALLAGDAKLGMAKAERAASLVREGAKAAVIELRGPDGLARIIWPEGELVVEGEPPRASKIATGLLHPALLDAKERAAALVEALKASPTVADWRAACSAAGIDDDTAVAAWKLICTQGWDAAAKALAARATEAKGAWCAITGARAYQPKAAETWQPAGYETEDLTKRSLAALEIMAGEAAAERDRALMDRAVSAAERERLTQLATSLDELREALASANEEHERALAAQQERVAALQGVSQLPPACPCPHCGGIIEIFPEDDPGGLPLRKPATGLKQVAPRELAQLKAGADGAIARVKAAAAAASALAAKVQAAEEAAKRLAEMPAADPEAVAKAEQTLAEAKALVDAVKRTQEARQRHAAVVAWSKAAELAGPAGARKTKLAETLALVNAGLADLCEAAGWPAVAISDDLAVSLGGRPYGALSASEQWRCDAAIALEVGRRDGSALVVLDGADILDTGGRNGLIRAVEAAGVAALILMTAPMATAEKLASAGIPAWFVSGGSVEAVAIEERRAAA